MYQEQLRRNYLIIFISLTLVILLIVGAFINGYWHKIKYPYVAGKTGKKCYLSGTEHGGVKYHIYFKTLTECENYVKQNQ